MTVLFSQEPLGEIVDELKPLLARHWSEIALHQDTIKLNVDWDAYFKLEDDGALFIYTARDDGILVGYFIVIAVSHLHYKDHVFAHNDVIFVAPEHRRKSTGARLIQFVEAQLKLSGVSVMMINTKRHQPFDDLLIKLQFSESETIYSKLLGVD